MDFVSAARPAADAAWLDGYKRAHSTELEADADFAAWLEDEYVPIAGGWQY